MSRSMWLSAIPVVGLVAISCGDDGGTGGAGGTTGSTSIASGSSSTTVSSSGSTSSSTQSSSASSSASSSTASSGSSSASSSAASSTGSTVASSSSSGGGNVINGCDEALAKDMTGQAQVTIMFPNLNLTFDPSCLKVSAGTIVTFQGPFLNHPLAGGGSPPTVDATSPITETTSGTTKSFTMSALGGYGFFCEAHYMFGMKGAIFVE